LYKHRIPCLYDHGVLAGQPREPVTGFGTERHGGAHHQGATATLVVWRERLVGGFGLDRLTGGAGADALSSILSIKASTPLQTLGFGC